VARQRTTVSGDDLRAILAPSDRRTGETWENGDGRGLAAVLELLRTATATVAVSERVQA
jgi:hypothetical protein